jgi:hypothetical protein
LLRRLGLSLRLLRHRAIGQQEGEEGGKDTSHAGTMPHAGAGRHSEA